MTDIHAKMTLKQINKIKSPNENPLLKDAVVKSKERRITSGLRNELVDQNTGEIQAVSTIHRVKQVDDAEFVKVFAEGIKAMYGLTKTGMRVFQAILEEYQSTKMNGGYADSIYISWFDNGLSGRDIGMSESTYHRGLKELLINRFISPRTPNLYWVNPALFFKGDRVAFIRQYNKKSKAIEGDAHLQKDAFSG